MLQKLRRSLERHLFGKDPFYQDPYDDPAEQFYARIYLKYLLEKIDSEFRYQQINLLDVGCHTGRLAIPLARAGHRVTAIDSSRFHLGRAQEHARTAGVNCRFLKGDGFRLIRRMPAESFDLILSTEVLYQRPDFQGCMENLLRLVRPGGLLATSHRTRFFYLTRALREGDFATAQFVLHHAEGPIANTYFNWQTPKELQEIYQALGIDLLLLRPVGVFTGNGGDGMAKFWNLGAMSEEEREAIFDVEAHDSDEFAGLGRYLLAIGRKRGS